MGPVARVSGVVTPVSLPSRRSTARSLVFFLAAGAVVLALVAGAIAVGSGPVRLTAVVPAPSESASSEPSPAPSAPSASITPEPSESAPGRGAPWILFGVNQGSGLHSVDQLWGIRADGSGAHAIEGGSAPVAWSPDGTRLLMNDGHIRVAEVGDNIGPFTEAGIAVPDGQQWEAFDFARDNERVVFVQKSKCPNGSASTGSPSSGVVLAVYVAETAGANCYVLSIIDLRTGTRTELGSTLVKDQTSVENLALELPAWSPDGTKIAYTRLDEPHDSRELWIVNADGTNPAKVELDADVSVMEPRWSPDGTRISFTSLTWPSETVSASAVYVANVESGHVERVTTGSNSAARQLCCAEWTDDTHLRVADQTGPDKFWLATLGTNPPEAQLLADLTGALAAIDPSPRVSTYSAPGDPGRTFFWQPVSALP